MFYTYLWMREDGTPYYVGKGKDARAWTSHKGHRPPKNRTDIIIQTFESEEDAFFAEKFLIAYYGRKIMSDGCLINLTEGGEGTAGNRSKLGQTLSAETRRKIADFRRGKKHSRETRQKLSRPRGPRIFSLQHRQSLSKALLGRSMSPAARLNMSMAQRRRHAQAV